MLAAAALALRDVFSPPFRGVLLKSLALTLSLLAGLWLALQWVVVHFVDLPWAWLDTAISVLSGIGFLVVLGFLVAPIAALFAGLFLDDVADIVERTHYPGDPPGRALPFVQWLAASVRFLAIVLLVNLAALSLVLAAGFGFLVFLVANAYLLGREYFELAALRHDDAETVRSLQTRNRGTIFAAGLLIAGFLAIPILNLLGPLFAAAFMVHLRKRLAA